MIWLRWQSILLSRNLRWRKQSSWCKQTSSKHRNLRRPIMTLSTMVSQFMVETRCGAETESGSRGRSSSWCGTWRVIKAPLDVTYPIEEWKKPGKHWQRRVAHLNYLKRRHFPPQETLSASLRELGRQVQIKLVDSTEVETMAGSDG